MLPTTRQLYDHPDSSGPITLHTAEDFEGMHAAGRLASECLDMITEHVVAGVSTGELDRRIQDFVEGRGAVSATIGYRGYQHASCISLNEVVCHGIPSDDEQLVDKDILNIDVTVIVDGWHGDTSRMYIVGGSSHPTREKLVRVTYEAMWHGINAVRPGATLGDVGAAIQKHGEKAGFSIVRQFVGHGLGEQFHMAPNIFHFGKPGKGVELVPGMLFTIEPMLNVGTYRVEIDESDGWTARTRDRKSSAQFEHSVGVTADGFEIFTTSPKGFEQPPYL
ncbi:MAG TPA: type I methionyl aminopeptidase [Alphaproteobacteria bacterium]|nr:type I methionyl aminopeptidase [Pseudomonadota bacterium]MEC8154386.1 type I methionyl aminopeptidase [Pseudomonadota bacterium]MEC8709973.1 type I methionyl aminopeptidase [Pseudomonadota bacterium]HCI00995.1 type I methionyl aminopeptidase [Alphaproteobacteria bacterium]